MPCFCREVGSHHEVRVYEMDGRYVGFCFWDWDDSKVDVFVGSSVTYPDPEQHPGECRLEDYTFLGVVPWSEGWEDAFKDEGLTEDQVAGLIVEASL